MCCARRLEVIRLDAYAYTFADQKSLLALAKRLTGGFDGAFSFEAYEYRVMMEATVAYGMLLPVGQSNSVAGPS